MKNRKILLLVVLAVTLVLGACNSSSETSGGSTSSQDSLSFESEAESKPEESSATETSEVSEEISQIYQTPEEYIRYGIADAVEKASDSIVSINVTRRYSSGFYGEYTSIESGSGVIVSKNGYIATNCHVIDGVEKITVYLSDGTELEAELKGKDAKTDLAVIKIESEKELSPAVFAETENLRLGDFVFAIGNVLGKYSGSVSFGIVSSFSRNVTVNGEEMTMLQTDAALNSGNSGGGLFDSHGYLVGIIAAKDSNEEAEGVGFAIPADIAKAVLEDIITHGYVTGRPTLGFETVDITSLREAAYYGVEWIGVYISSIQADSNGEVAGLRSRDYIYSVNNEVVTTSDRLQEILQESKIGDTLLLEIWRGNDSFDVILMIGEDVG